MTAMARTTAIAIAAVLAAGHFARPARAACVDGVAEQNKLVVVRKDKIILKDGTVLSGKITYYRKGDDIEIRASARSFLHHQVRNMVGSLAMVGEGKWTGDDLAAALAARDRTAAGPNAPAEGLYLIEVSY